MPETRLLLIENTPAHAIWLEEAFAPFNAADGFRLSWARSLEEGLQCLTDEENGFSAILIDLNLPDSQGLESLQRIQAACPDLPVVVLSGESDAGMASQAMQAGAQDYLIQGQVDGEGIARALRHAIERKHAELDLARRARELQAVYETSLEINSQVELDALLQSLVERSARLIGAPTGGLCLVEPDGETLRLAYLYNLREEYRGVALKMGEGLSGKVAQSGQPLAVDRIQNWPDLAKAGDGAEFHRALAVPLRAGGRVIGVITLSDSRDRGSWGEDEIRLVSLLADQAAIAVQNARLLEVERQRAAELARSNAMIHALGEVAWRLSETLDSRQVLETLGSELSKLEVTAGVALLEGDPAELTIRHLSLEPAALNEVGRMLGRRLVGLRVPAGLWQPEDQIEGRKSYFHENALPLIGRLFEDTPPQLLEKAVARLNLTPSTPVLILPLVIKDQPLGMMAVWGRQLRRDDLPAFNVFANQVAVALENSRLYHRLERQATLDELTGLYNRRGFFVLAEQQLRLAQRAGIEVLLMFIDVDQLKQINDTCGHNQGDLALVKTAESMRTTFRAADILARISGDEFAVLAYSSNEAGAPALMERLRREVERTQMGCDLSFNLTVSAGYAAWAPGMPASLDELLARADAQMYQVKRKRATGELNR